MKTKISPFQLYRLFIIFSSATIIVYLITTIRIKSMLINVFFNFREYFLIKTKLYKLINIKVIRIEFYLNLALILIFTHKISITFLTDLMVFFLSIQYIFGYEGILMSA